MHKLRPKYDPEGAGFLGSGIAGLSPSQGATFRGHSVPVRYGVGLTALSRPPKAHWGRRSDDRKGEGEAAEGRGGEGTFPGKVVKDKSGVNNSCSVESFTVQSSQSVRVRPICSQSLVIHRNFLIHHHSTFSLFQT